MNAEATDYRVFDKSTGLIINQTMTEAEALADADERNGRMRDGFEYWTAVKLVEAADLRIDTGESWRDEAGDLYDSEDGVFSVLVPEWHDLTETPRQAVMRLNNEAIENAAHAQSLAAEVESLQAALLAEQQKNARLRGSIGHAAMAYHARHLAHKAFTEAYGPATPTNAWPAKAVDAATAAALAGLTE